MSKVFRTLSNAKRGISKTKSNSGSGDEMALAATMAAIRSAAAAVDETKLSKTNVSWQNKSSSVESSWVLLKPH
jgi:hypothetical protein